MVKEKGFVVSKQQQKAIRYLYELMFLQVLLAILTLHLDNQRSLVCISNVAIKYLVWDDQF